tara:strand:+ start:56 stop:1399 length:1344 start_codon:yes stop_codon:yes gene_type:complete
MAIDKKINYKDKRLTKAQQKKIKPVNQGGGPNYLGKQETATVPKKWLSSPDHVVAELAYITPREQKILLDENLYGSLKGKPNKGPGGIMSLQGDLGGYSSNAGGTSSGKGAGDVGQGKGGRSNEDYKNTDYYNMMTGTGTTATSAGGDTYRSNNISKGAVPEYVNTPDGMKYVGSKYKSYGQPSFLGNLFSGGASGYRGTYGTNTGFFDKYFGSKIGTRRNPTTGNLEYFSKDNRVGNVKPGIGGRILGGLASLLTGVPLVGGIIGNTIDKYKPKSYGEKMTDEERSRTRALQMVDGELVDTRNIESKNIPVRSNVPMENLTMANLYSPNAFNQKPPANLNNLESLINATNPNDLGLDIAPGYEGNGVLDLETDNSYDDIKDYYAKVTLPQYNQLKALGQVGNTQGKIDDVKGTVDPAKMGTFDSIQPSEWKEIFEGKKFKDITQIG